jgi:hypothetical protein
MGKFVLINCYNSLVGFCKWRTQQVRILGEGTARWVRAESIVQNRFGMIELGGGGWYKVLQMVKPSTMSNSIFSSQIQEAHQELRLLYL